ncbi:hypothetical protein [Lacrimispora sp.]|uniref:hypothetical protein n=1 Tax=Lacrimispora sp. TaxID=2719234 RepID=UPI0028A82D4C|nr:hypothetical protein [Lacrimispora sp.]
MLDLALNHEEELKKKFRSTWFSEKYKYWTFTNYSDELQIAESTWVHHQFASLDSTGEVIGYIGYDIDRASDLVYGLNIINFTDKKVIFGIDVGNVLRDIFEKFNFRKLTFSVAVGNPIESSYDRMIGKYNGRIVGIQKKQVRLIDGQFYDRKLYEILAEDYLKVVEI